MEGFWVKEFLTIKDVVEATGGIISEATLRWWDATGKGGPRSGRLGRRVVYRREDVQAWLDAAFDGERA